MPPGVTKIGKFGLYIPDELWFDVATLKIDLRPVIDRLEKAGQPPKKPVRDPQGRFVKVGGKTV